MQEYDISVIHKRGVLNTNADCLSRFRQPTSPEEGTLPDWDRGDYNITPSTFLCFMATSVEKEEDHHQGIWVDEAVINFIKTQCYETNASAIEKDRVCRRAKGFR